MTPQCNINLLYKQPLLNSQSQVKVLNNNTSTKKTNSNQKTGKKDKKNRIKCVIVGDQAVGKTALVVSYSNDTFPSDYIPTVYDKYNVVVLVDGDPISVELCDTGGEEAFQRLRNLCYPETDVFILCFSVANRRSFDSVCTQWAEELTRLESSVVLVGTQADLRHHSEEIRRLKSGRYTFVSQEEAVELAERLNAPYVETSAKTCTHLKEAFDLAITLALKKKKKMKFWKRFCCI